MDILTNPLFLGFVLPFLVSFVTKAGAGKETTMVVTFIVAGAMAVVSALQQYDTITSANLTMILTQVWVLGQGYYFIVEKVVAKYVNSQGLSAITKANVGIGANEYVEGD